MQTDVNATPRRSLWARIQAQAAALPFSGAFSRFLAIGAVAFVINAFVLFLFYDALPLLPDKDTHVDFLVFTHPDISLLVASAIAVETAITFKFFALEHWAFDDRIPEGHPVVRFLRFNASCFASSVIVVAVVNVFTPVFDISPYIATAVGVALSFMVNWAFSSYFIWPQRKRAARAASG